MEKISAPLKDKIIVNSEIDKQLAIDKKIAPADKIVKIYNGIEKDEYCVSDEEIVRGRSKFRIKADIGEDVAVVGVIGRLVWQKGFTYFIEAIPGVLKEFKEARFLLVGEGELEDMLKVKSKKLKLEDKIIFTGFRNDIKEIMASVDVFVMPSLREGLPVVLLEAMAMKKPIVAADIEGIMEVLENGVSGLLVPPRDTKALTEAIIYMLAHKDKSLQMGLTARRVVTERFGVDTMVQKVEDVYQELLLLNQK